MEKNLENIDNLFNKAKTAEPVIDSKFARNVINKRALLASDMFHITKGIKIMNLISSIALVSAATSLISLQSPSEQKAQNYINESKTALVQTVKKIKSAKLEELDIAADKPQVIKQTIKVSKDEQKQNVKEKIFDNKLDIDGINPIELNSEELKIFGLVVSDDCEYISFIDEWSNSKRIMLLNPDGYLNTLQYSEQAARNLKVDNITSILPRMVTDIYGNKKFSSFTQGDNIRAFISEYKDTLSKDDKQSLIHSGNFAMVLQMDSMLNQLPNMSMLDSVLENTKRQIKPIVTKFHYNIQENENGNIQDITKLQSLSGVLSNDSSDVLISTDTEGNKIIVSSKDAEFSLSVTTDKDNKNAATIALGFSMLKDINSSKPEDLSFTITPNININELLPIKILLKDSKTGEMNKAMIIWFEASNDVLAKLPETIKRKLSPEFEAMTELEETCPKPPVTGEKPYFDIWRACSGAIEQLKTYPTPASQNLNYKFNLDQERDLSIYVCNLSGEIISNPVENKHYGIGTFENRIDINDLKPGMYLLVVSSDIGEKAVQRFVVL